MGTIRTDKPLAIYHEHPDWFRPLFAEPCMPGSPVRVSEPRRTTRRRRSLRSSSFRRRFSWTLALKPPTRFVNDYRGCESRTNGGAPSLGLWHISSSAFASAWVVIAWKMWILRSSSRGSSKPAKGTKSIPP